MTRLFQTICPRPRFPIFTTVYGAQACAPHLALPRAATDAWRTAQVGMWLQEASAKSVRPLLLMTCVRH